MLRLNPDILFDIGKQLIEDGDSDAVIRFALSGKEPLQAMAKVFASVTTLKLYNDRYSVGWDDRCTTFEFDKTHCNFFFQQIGNYITSLHINGFFNNTYFIFLQPYQSLFDKIIAKKQLKSFSTNKYCSDHFLNEFLPKFSSTLKEVKCHSAQITPILLDSLNLDSLTFLDGLSFTFQLMLPRGNTICPFMAAIKELTFNETDQTIFSHLLNEITKYFSSLETLNFKF